MRDKKHIFAVLLTASLISLAVSEASPAAGRKKITSVSLTITSDIQVGDQIDDDCVEVETNGSKYEVDSWQIDNDGFEWEETDLPKLKVTLTADEDYYFAMTSASSVKLKGAGAKYVSASKQNSSETLVITLTLSPLKEQVGDVVTAQWTAKGQAGWSPAAGAGSYELRLYKGGKPLGSAQVTAGTSFDFSQMMTRIGDYTFRVRGINRYNSENKGEWKESESAYADEVLIRAFRETGGSSWQQDDTGWWYRNADNTYTRSEWQCIGGKWYYFNDQGYMATGWVSWKDKWYYCKEDGSMAVDAATPDGYRVDSDGVLVQ